MVRSLIRIVTVSTTSALTLALLAALIIRQPGFASTTYEGTRADAAALQRHVAFLTSAHLENRDPVPYIADAFRAAGGDVHEQVFNVRGHSYRNVIARFGPASGALTIVGAHYD